MKTPFQPQPPLATTRQPREPFKSESFFPLRAVRCNTGQRFFQHSWPQTRNLILTKFLQAGHILSNEYALGLCCRGLICGSLILALSFHLKQAHTKYIMEALKPHGISLSLYTEARCISSTTPNSHGCH